MNVQDWTTVLAASIGQVSSVVFEYLPSIAGSLALLGFGWLLATVLRTLTRRLSEHVLETLARQRVARTKAIGARTQQSRAYQSAPRFIGVVVYWTVLLFFLAAAVEALGLPAVSNVLALVTAYLPRLLAGIAIVVVGIWAGEFSRTLVARTAAKLAHGEHLGRLAQAIVIIVFVIMATEQLGIDSTILLTSLATAFAATFGAAALAFGLGARATVANIIAARYVRRSYRTGDRVRIGDLEGTIGEITDTAVVLDGADGRLLVPARHFVEEVSVLLREES